MAEKEKKGLITKGRFELQFRGIECLNCGHPLDMSDRYCPNCSQANSTKKLVLKDFVDEFLSNIINYDSKLLQTLTALLLHPGSITKDYINGKRMAYTNPFRFLLSLAFIYFLLVSYNSALKELDNFKVPGEAELVGFQINVGEEEVEETQTDSLLTKSTPDISNKTKNLEDALKEKLVKSPDVSAAIDSIKNTTAQYNKDSRIKDSLMTYDPKEYIRQQLEKGEGQGFDLANFYYKKISSDSLSTFQQAVEKYGIPQRKENEKWFYRTKSMHKVLTQPAAFIRATISKLPIVIFLLLPVLSFFIWLVYIRQKYSYTDHLIFSFHSQSLFFILLILSWIVDLAFGTMSTGWFLFLFAIYLYKSMKRFYRQGWFKTLVKYVFLNVVFFLLTTITILVLFAGSAITY